jgi:hypothetical protein
MSDCQSVCVSHQISYEAYDITMLSGYLRISANFFIFVCGPCRFKGKQAIISSHNYLLILLPN